MDEAKIEIVERLKEPRVTHHRVSREHDEEYETVKRVHPVDPLRLEAALAIQSLVKALDGAERFISNGIELGFIRMPDRDDPALETLPNIRSVLSKLRGSS